MIHQHRPQPGGADRLDRDPRAYGALDEVGHAGDQRVGVGRHRGEGLATREGEQAMGERGRPPRRALRRVDVAVDIAGPPLGEPDLQHLEAA